MNAAELQAYLYREIPLSKAMGVVVVEPGPERVILEAPLEPNTNHRSTAFGGSVSALATLAGWALVHRRLREAGNPAQVVVQNGTTDYLLPVHTGFRATCHGIDEAEWRRLVRALERSGMGRARVNVEIEAEGDVVARFEGRYVGLRPSG